MTRSFLVYAILFAHTSLQASELTVTSIDYASPKTCLTIASSLGNASDIKSQSILLKGRNERDTIKNILQWMSSELTCDPKKAYHWRNFDSVTKEHCYASCADEAIVCGALLKSAGIPTVWVKTMDVEWIWDFKKQRPFHSWSGHVFLEVYIEGKWMLLNPGSKTIYESYPTSSQILPGNRFAYHKGHDPKEMIMSLQWEQWKSQTAHFFKKLSPSVLPVDEKDAKSLVPIVDIIGNNPYYKTMSATARKKGWHVGKTFNTNYEKILPTLQGDTLLIETHNRKPIIPVITLEKFYPGISAVLKTSKQKTTINNKTIIFIDFSKTLDPLSK